MPVILRANGKNEWVMYDDIRGDVMMGKLISLVPEDGLLYCPQEDVLKLGGFSTAAYTRKLVYDWYEDGTARNDAIKAQIAENKKFNASALKDMGEEVEEPQEPKKKGRPKKEVVAKSTSPKREKSSLKKKKKGAKK